MPKMFIALNLAFVYNTENHNLSVFEFVHSIVSVVSSINHAQRATIETIYTLLVWPSQAPSNKMTHLTYLQMSTRSLTRLIPRKCFVLQSFLFNQ